MLFRDLLFGLLVGDTCFEQPNNLVSDKDVAISNIAGYYAGYYDKIPLQRHFRVLTKFAHVESRLSGHKRQREVVFYAPVNLCARRACSTSVAVGLIDL